MPLSFGQLLTLLVLFGVSAWAIRRAGNRLRRELEDPPSSAQGMLTKEEVDAILASGLATPETLFVMSAKEQRVLAISAMALTKGKRSPPG
jgi:hypothetical protein